MYSSLAVLPSLRELQEVEVGHIHGRADAGRLGSIFASLTALTRLEVAFEWCAAGSLGSRA